MVSLSSAAEEWLYTVRPGDEIWNIASQYCGSATFAQRIVEFNQLADARAIRPGSRLRIPVSWLVRQPVSAEILNVRGSALVLRPDPEVARVGLNIEMGNRLATQDGTVVVGFADGSTLVVAPESEVLFNVLTAYGDTGMVDTHLRFYRGRGTSRIIRRNDASRFRISSPAGTAAVRGTEFRVAVAGERTLTETLTGDVGFIRQAETPVPAGFGVAASDSGIRKEQLLPGPNWISAPARFAPGSELRWEELGGARYYRVLVYAAADPDAVIAERVVPQPPYALEGMTPGLYRVAVRGISGLGLEGYDSGLDVEVGTPPPVTAAAGTSTPDAVQLRWTASAAGPPYSVQISGDETFSNVAMTLTADTEQLSPPLSPGRYYWRVKDGSSAYGEAVIQTVQPPAPEIRKVESARLNLSLAWTGADADAFRLQISRNRGFTDLVVNEQLKQPAFAGPMPGYGLYHVKILVTSNGIESQPVTTEVRLSGRRPWWLLAILAVPLFL